MTYQVKSIAYNVHKNEQIVEKFIFIETLDIKEHYQMYVSLKKF